MQKVPSQIVKTQVVEYKIWRTLLVALNFVNFGVLSIYSPLFLPDNSKIMVLNHSTRVMRTSHSRENSLNEAPHLATFTALPRYLALGYFFLIVYASLHPFLGWRASGLSPFVFLEASRPRYWTTFDLLINIFAYAPFGFLLTQSLRCRYGRWSSMFLAFLLGTGLSFILESIQAYLPSRVPSNLDLLCNSMGSASGAILAGALGNRLFAQLARLQKHLLAPVPRIELGLVLIGLWLLTQLSPETVLFGTGDLRYFFNITPAVPYAAPSFFAIETAIIVCHTVAIGLTVHAILAVKGAAYKILPCFFLLALLVRTLAALILVSPSNAFAWLTPGADFGLLLGSTLLFASLLCPAPWRIAFTGLCLMFGTILVNLAPANPYSVSALEVWRQGHFLNFNGLTRLTASFWPFLALPYLIFLGRRI